MVENYIATMRNQGRIVVPKEVRNACGWDKGDQIIFSINDKGVQISSVKQSLENLRKLVNRHNKNGKSALEELFEMRREEFKKEEAEFDNI